MLANDTDVDGDPLSAILVHGPAHGALTLAANGSSISTAHGSVTLSRVTGLTFIRGDGTADTLLVVRGSLAAINAALDGAKYQPDKNFVGIGGLTMTSDDLGSTGAGGPLQDVDSVPIKMT